MADADLAAVAKLIGDPARAAMLRALLDGRALTAGELARVAERSAPAVSAHLGQLLDGGLIEVLASGRHRYFRLAGPSVAAALEALAGVSPPARVVTLRASAAARALGPARLCYDHLAGALGVDVFDALVHRGGLLIGADGVALTPTGVRWFTTAGVDVEASTPSPRPRLRTCLDWTERRFHLAGSLAAALADAWLAAGWIERRAPGERGLHTTDQGAAAIRPLLSTTTRQTRPA